MFKRRLKNPIFLFYLLVIYISLQFVWWLLLIFSLYGKIYTEPSILNKKILMLVGEGFVFMVILIFGVIIIRRAFKRERELNKQHENFLLSVSHELKTPISSIQLFLETLEKRDLDTKKRDKIYRSSLTEVNRLDSLVENILMTRSISSNNYFLNKENVRLDKLIEELILKRKTTLFASHNIKLELEEASIEIDKIAFESILLNIIGNAIKYSPKDSSITVNLSKKENSITLLISDEGSGIENKLKEIVFSKFYRIENEMTRKSKGTGLGLYTTKHLVEQHGGKIRLKDNQPIGLIIEIIFENE